MSDLPSTRLHKMFGDTTGDNEQALLALGKRLRDVRKEKGFSLKEAAALVTELAGRPIHFTTIGKLETGKMKPDLSWVGLLSGAYKAEIGEVLFPQLSAGSPRAVPLVAWEGGDRWDLGANQIRIGTALTPAGGPHSMAIQLVPSEFAAMMSASGGGYVVVDPDDTELVDLGFYLIRTESRDYVASYRASGQEFLLCLSPWERDTRLAVGSQPFETIGRIRFAGLRLEE